MFKKNETVHKQLAGVSSEYPVLHFTAHSQLEIHKGLSDLVIKTPPELNVCAFKRAGSFLCSRRESGLCQIVRLVS